MKYLPDEQSYPHLAEFLRSGGTLEIGEDVTLASFARLHVKDLTLNVVTMKYPNFSAILKEMESQARQYFERQNKQ